MFRNTSFIAPIPPGTLLPPPTGFNISTGIRNPLLVISSTASNALTSLETYTILERLKKSRMYNTRIIENDYYLSIIHYPRKKSKNKDDLQKTGFCIQFRSRNIFSSYLSMNSFLMLVSVILSLLLTLLIALQSKGSGLSIIPNGEDFGKFERRGAEKVIHQITIVLVIVWVFTALVQYLTA